jgi:membrane protease subunit HflC
MKAIILVVLAIGAIVLWQSAYKVDQTELVVLTRFGEIRQTHTAPGLRFKAPFIEAVTRLDKRLLRVDVQPAAFPDIENQFLDIDAYVRYRIRPNDADIRRFRTALINETGAAAPIGQIVVAALREEVGGRRREQIIGGQISVNEDGTQTVAPIQSNGVPAREELTRIVTASVQQRADQQGFGIDVQDVRIKRADFPDSIVESIYIRMRSEREVQAQRLRAEGEEEFLTKTADVNRRVQVIAAEADRDSNVLRGEGEAEAIRVLGLALGCDPDLFSFRRSLEAYASFLQSNSTLVLPADSPLLQFLQDPNGTGASTDAPTLDEPLPPECVREAPGVVIPDSTPAP